MQRYILALDQGTTGTTALVFDEKLQIKGSASVDFPQHYPNPSWVEHDLNEIWESLCVAIKIVFAKNSIDPRSIAAIGITNQRETTCLWERTPKATPVTRAIVWQDRRTSLECDRMKARGLEKTVHKHTGLLLDPYFSATKLAWMLKNVPGAGARAKSGRLAFGTIDSYLLYRMTGVHATDPTNASRTLLMSLKDCNWDPEMLRLFKIPRTLLPEILPNATQFGTTKGVPGLPDGIPITGIAGDQQAALFGQACFSVGSVKCTYGTGAFILANIGNKPVLSKNRLLTSVAWKLGEETTYCLEGSAFIAGAAVQWVRDGLGVIESSEAIEKLAGTVTDSDGVVFVPALSGMGAPHWLPKATGLITGITRRTTKAHIARATLEGIAFQVQELLEAMTADLGKKLQTVKVDGGASADDLLMQFQADLLGINIVRAKIMETTALGAGLQAGLSVGIWKDLPSIQKQWESSKQFKPEMTAKVRKTHLERWQTAMGAVKLLAKS